MLKGGDGGAMRANSCTARASSLRALWPLLSPLANF